MGEIKPLLRTNLSPVAILKLILDINIQAIEEVLNENKGNPGVYARTILELGGTLEDIPKMGNNWILLFKDALEKLIENEQIPKFLSYVFLENMRWFNTLRSTLYIMEEDLLIASQPSVNILWNYFFEVEDDLRGNFVKKLKIRETYGKFTGLVNGK